MLPVYYKGVYKTPDFHQPPQNAELATNTQYPNLNSSDYSTRQLNRDIRMHEGWECICLNGEAPAVIATNKLSGREWRSSLWGFENIEDNIQLDDKQNSGAGDGIKNVSCGVELNSEEACFKLQCGALTTQLQYMCQNIVSFINICFC